MQKYDHLCRYAEEILKDQDFFLHHSDFSKTHDYGSSSYPLSDIIEREMECRIAKVIDKLPAQCKKIFLMSRFEDLSHQEIADRLNLSVNTVKFQIMNALKKLQAALKNMMIILTIMMNLKIIYWTYHFLSK